MSVLPPTVTLLFKFSRPCSEVVSPAMEHIETSARTSQGTQMILKTGSQKRIGATPYPIAWARREVCKSKVHLLGALSHTGG